jgi:GrpB-like predicted nucleotidyltransferase (UPF0157 family)
MAAGKTTVARLLAARFARGVHLEGDFFRRSIVRGREEMTPELSPAALDQLRLRYRLAAAAADTYAEAGFSVALEDVVAGPLLGDEMVDAILAATPPSASPIEITEYDAAWPMLFEEIAVPLRRSLADLGVKVEHVGSTAVPGLAAKPVIDIDVVVHAPDDVLRAIERLRTLGYVYQGNKGIAGREAFLWPSDAVRHHLYVVVACSRPHADHVDFRDYLRQHPDIAAQYAALKRRLAKDYRDDQQGYTNAKSEFVAGVLEEARCGE